MNTNQCINTFLYFSEIITYSIIQNKNHGHNVRNHHHKEKSPDCKQWKCKDCSYRACHRSTLIVHQRTHTGEKPFKCTLCNKSFARKDYLTKHIRLHTGEKPHKCDICLRQFKQRSGLTSHVKNVHQKVKKERKYVWQQFGHKIV